MGRKAFDTKDEPLVAAGFVPAAICARWVGYALSTVHRAVAAKTIGGQRVGQRLYVDWDSFRSYVGPLAAHLPETASGAVEGHRAH